VGGEQNGEENLKRVAGNKKLIFKKISPSLQVALKYYEVIAFMWLGLRSQTFRFQKQQQASLCKHYSHVVSSDGT
jgi:hypothetical protein